MQEAAESTVYYMCACGACFSTLTDNHPIRIIPQINNDEDNIQDLPTNDVPLEHLILSETAITVGLPPTTFPTTTKKTLLTISLT
jgi:hypothetical protein